MHVLKITVKILLVFILSILFISTLVYYRTVIYNFPEIKKFTGNTWYNPYEKITHPPLKANFHAHSIAWSGMTNGKDEPEDIIKTYQAHGYDVISISNYHTIYENRQDPYFIPAYEHGYNMQKTHYNVLGADKVSFFDYPFFQTASHKQQVIYTLQNHAEILVINHPSVRNGFSLSDMEKLQNYQLIEVWNPFGRSEEHWDKALSAGHPVFLLANDDSHTLKKGSFKMWNMIYAAADKDSIYRALLAGRNYGVRKKKNDPPPFSFHLGVRNDSLMFVSTLLFDTIQLISDDAVLLKAELHASQLNYPLGPSQTYARIKLISNDFEILLNPVIRYNGNSLYDQYNRTIPVHSFRTSIFRAGVALFHIFILFSVLRICGMRIPFSDSVWHQRK
ncbi:MAG: hypothetical protein H7X71_03110 [Chitinophagales bacterium]|nr:hypothetical protein [Chitinophagales bacterium]